MRPGVLALVAAALATGCVAVPSGPPVTRSGIAPTGARFEVRDVTYRTFLNGEMRNAYRQVSGSFGRGDEVKRAFESAHGPVDPDGENGSVLIKVTSRAEVSPAYAFLTVVSLTLIPSRSTYVSTVRVEFTSPSGEDLGEYRERQRFHVWYWLLLAPAQLFGSAEDRIAGHWTDVAAEAAEAVAGR